MRMYEGQIGLVGAGTWSDGGGGGKTVLSVLEVGDKQLKRIVLDDYLGNYLHAGQHARVWISRGLSQGLITRPFVAAVETNGKKHKIGSGSVLFMGVAKSLLYAFPVGLLLGAIIHPVLGILGVAGVFAYYLKDFLGLVRL